MKECEYQLLVELWDYQSQRYYWADNEMDPRSSQERLQALKQEGWEVLSAFPCAEQARQRNYLLKRAVAKNINY